MSPALYLIPVTLGPTAIDKVLPAYNREVILGIRHFIVEEIRTARRFLKAVERSIDIDSLTFYEMQARRCQSFLAIPRPLAKGRERRRDQRSGMSRRGRPWCRHRGHCAA